LGGPHVRESVWHYSRYIEFEAFGMGLMYGL